MLRLIKGAACLLPLLVLLVSPAGADIPTGLDLRLLKTLTSNLGDNQAISPFVLSSAMTQMWLAVGGDTRKQISKALGLEGSTELAMAQKFLPAYKSAIAGLSAKSGNAITIVFNRIYVKKGISLRPSFSQLLRVIYGSSVRQFSSAARTAAEINTDVSTATRGRIRKLVTAETLEQLGMALVSALYFKDQWRWAFRSSGKELFLTASGNKRVNMMKFQKELKYGRFDTFDALELPYRDGQYSMLILRPLERSMASVGRLRLNLDKLSISNIFDGLFTLEVSISMPPFTIDVSYSLRKALSLLGVKKLFSTTPDGRGIGRFPQRESDIYHSVFLKVNEEGTEAAGAVATVTHFMAKTRRIVDFRLDRPFFTILYNKAYKFVLFFAYLASP